MANQYLAKLGILLSVDAAELSKGFSEAEKETKKFNRSVEAESKRAIQEIYKMRDAIEDYGKEVTMVTKVEREFRDGGRYANLAKNEAVRQQILKEAAAVDALAASQKKAMAGQMGGTGSNGKLTPYQLQALSYQTTDIVTSLAGGQNPLLVLLQQGGQLKDQFGSLKGVFEAFKTVLTPVKLGIGAVVAILGTLAFAAYKGSEEFKRLNNDLALTHNYAGITAKGFQDLAEVISTKTHSSIGEVKGALSEIVASGKFTSTSLAVVTETIANMARLSGKSANEMAKELIPSLDGSAKSAKSLNDTYHFLNISQYKQIELLEQQGKKQEAIKLTATALNDSIKEQARYVGYLALGWENATNWFSKYWDKLKSIGAEKTDEEKMMDAAADIRRLSANIAQNFSKENKEKLRQALIAYDSYAQLVAQKQQEMNKKEIDNQKLTEYERAGGLKRIEELNDATQKRIVDANISFSEIGATEQERIEWEAVRKMADAAIEYKKRLRENGYGLEAEEYKALQDKLLAISQEADQKKYALSLQESAKFRDRQANDQLAIDKQKEEYKVRQDNILISEQDLKIAMDRLQVEKNIVEIQKSKMTDADKQKYIEREKDLGKQKEAVDAMGEKLKVLGSIGQSVFSNMGSAIDNFVKTGKFAFKDFAKSVIQDIIAIILKAQALRLLSGAGGFLGSLFSGGPTGLASLGPSVNASFPTLATGGSILGNNPTIVGEAGPELFIPNTSGTIIPNSSLSSGMGSGPTINYNGPYIANMSAIDTQSASQFLAKNKDAVWAANQSANRSMPASR